MPRRLDDQRTRRTRPRRLAITAPGKVEVLEYEDPPLKPDQVLVKTELASGKHGTTTAGFQGLAFGGQDFAKFQDMRIFVEAEPQPDKQTSARKPGGTGTRGAGVIEEVGSEVTRLRKGDRVFGPMDVRETNICSEDRLQELGDLDPEWAMCTEPAQVSFHCVRESNVRFGDSVAVVGLGAIGLIAVQMARQAGAERVFAVDPLEIRRAWAGGHGAEEVLDPMACDAGLKIHEMTDGAGVDVAIEAAGSYAALNVAIRAARVCGTVCSAGFYQGEANTIHLGREWHHNRLNIIVPHGCGWGHTPRDYPRWTAERAQDVIVSMMRRGRLNVDGLLHPIVPIEEGPEVWRLIQEDPGKVIKFGVRFS